MKTSKNNVFIFILIILVFSVTLIACDNSDNGNGNNNNGNGTTENKGGTIVVHNSNPQYSADVIIYFNEIEIFHGNLGKNETVRKTSNNDTEWKVLYKLFSSGYRSKIGYMSKGETIYYNLGD